MSTSRQAFYLVLVVVASILVGVLLNTALLFVLGHNPMQAAGQDLTAYPGHMRLSLAVVHFFSFLFPALFFSWLLHRHMMWKELDLDRWVPARWLAMALLSLLLLLPIIQYSYQFNQGLPLPDWMIDMEAEATESIARLIQMNHWGEYLINLLIIAALPALGEEILFRGVIQPMGYRMWKKPGVSVWVTAALFSAIHLQFAGFLPRLILGGFLGYLFLWTRRLWLPIVVHFFNNALMVSTSYFLPEEAASLEESGLPNMPVFAPLLALLLLLPVGRFFLQVYQEIRQDDLSANEKDVT